MSPSSEWDEFLEVTFKVFATLKVVKDGLRHPENIQRAATFAAGVNAAFKAANAKEVES
jgi:hypothetical protein